MIKDLISTKQDFNDEEYFGRYHASFKVSCQVDELNALIEQVFCSISNRDTLKISISSDDIDESIVISTFNEKIILKFFDDYLIEVDDVLTININVDKQLVNGKLSIYSFEKFQSKICALLLLDVMRSMSSYLKNSNRQLIFEVMQNNFPSFSTKYISFLKFGMESTLTEEFDRIVKLSKAEYLGRFFNISEYTLLPEDFQLVKYEKENQITRLFAKITTMLSIVYIGYESSIDKGKLLVQISNDKIQKLSMDIDKIEYNPAIIDLYKWIVASDNYLDKVSITRDILSLNLNNSFVIDSEIIDIIQKTYNIAIKEKIEKFFEVKKETAEFITTVLNELSQIKTQIIEKFIYNIFAIGVFFSTTLIPTILETKSLDSIFTPDVRLIIQIAMCGSVIFCAFTNVKNYLVVRNYDSTLERLKNNFSEYYSIKELEQIFNVKHLGDIKKSIKYFSIIVSSIWILLSLVLCYIFK